MSYFVIKSTVITFSFSSWICIVVWGLVKNVDDWNWASFWLSRDFWELYLSRSSRTRVWMSTFVHTSSRSQFLESLNEYPARECKPGIKIWVLIEHMHAYCFLHSPLNPHSALFRKGILHIRHILSENFRII